MKKKLCYITFLTILFAFIFSLSVSALSPQEYASEQIESFDTKKILDALPDETREMLKEIGLTDFNFETVFNSSPRALFDAVKKMFSGVWKQPMRVFAELTALLILTAIIKASSPDENSSVQRGTELFCVSSFMILLLPHFACVLSHVVSVIKTQEIFIRAYIPVLLAVVAASGNPSLALSVNALTVGAAEIIVQFSNSFLIPITGIFIILCFADAFAPKFRLGGFVNLFKKSAMVSLGFCATLYSGLLTTKSVLAGTADSVASRGIKFALSSFVPVVGGALGEGLSSIVGGLTLLRSALGIFGIASVVLLILPTFLEIAVWNIFIYICASIGDLFENDKCASLLRGIASAFTFLNVFLLFQGMLLVVTTGLVLTIRAGG